LLAVPLDTPTYIFENGFGVRDIGPCSRRYCKDFSVA
jgi:hypothetical protein